MQFQIKIQHHRLELHFFSLPLLLLLLVLSGPEVHLLYPKSKNLNKTQDKEAMNTSSQGFQHLKSNKWHCWKEKRLHLGQLRTFWHSKSLPGSIKAVTVSPFLVCMDKICRSSLGRKRGRPNLKMENCYAAWPWEQVLPFQSSELKTTDPSICGMIVKETASQLNISVIKSLHIW